MFDSHDSDRTEVKLSALCFPVPHFGIANLDLHDRFVLFLHFSPSGSPLHDTEEQRYPHGVAATRSKHPYNTLGPTQK